MAPLNALKFQLVALCLACTSALGCTQEVLSAGDAAVGLTEAALTPSSASGNSLHVNVNGFLAADAMIGSTAASGWNYGASHVASVGQVNIGTIASEQRALVWFDPWQLPAPVNTNQRRIDIQSASLKLQVVKAPSSSMAVKLFAINTPWAEGVGTGGSTCSTATGGATWNKPNCALTPAWATGDFTEIGNSSISTTLGVQSLPLNTTTVANWNATEIFHGLQVRAATPLTVGKVADINTRDGWLAGKGEPPQLDITYSCKPGYEHDVTFGPGGCTGDAGMLCRNDGQCSSGECGTDGRCMGDNGAPCTGNAQCISGSCLNSTCSGFRVAVTGSRDTYIQSAYPLRSRGGEGELIAGCAADGSRTFKTMVDFPTPALPAPVVIGTTRTPRIVLNSSKVKLTQTVSPVDNVVLRATLRPITAPWGEGTNTGYVAGSDCGTGGATWSQSDCALSAAWPGNYLGGAAAVTTLDHFRGQKIWDLASWDVDNMRGSGHHGYMLDVTPQTGAAPAGGTWRYFSSSEGTGTWGGPPPTLVINYSCASGYTQGGASCLGEEGAVCSSDAQCGNNSCIDGICCDRGCSDVECGSVCGRACSGSCGSSEVCVGGSCVDRCANFVRDGNETGVDCGGSCKACVAGCERSQCGLSSSGQSCGTCPTGQVCVMNELDYVRWGECVDHCKDGALNYDETDIDCGGASCERCPGDCTCEGKTCGADDGCGHACTTGTCAAPSRPAPITMLATAVDRSTDAVRNTLGTLNDRWVGVAGSIASLTDNGDNFGCSGDSSARDAYFHFNLCSGTTVRIDAMGSAWSAAMGLYPASTSSFTAAHKLTCANTVLLPSNGPTSITRYLPPGDYYVVLRGTTTATTGNYALYIRDEDGTSPTCGGGGQPAQCGTFDRCPGFERVLSRLTDENGSDAVTSYTRSDSHGHEGFGQGALSASTASSGARLLFEGFEQETTWQQRWALTGSTTRVTDPSTTTQINAHADDATGRPSLAGLRLGGNAARSSSLQTTIDVLGATSLRLTYWVRTSGLDAASSGAPAELVTATASADGATPFTIGTANPTAWARQSPTFNVPSGTRRVTITLSLNANDGGEYAVIDGVFLTSSSGGVSALPTRGSSDNAPTWRQCNADGEWLTNSAAFTPPTGSETCPAIPGSCNCPANPTALTRTACTSDSNCTGGTQCMEVPAEHCSRVTGSATTVCPTDEHGMLRQRYCALPYASCAGQPTLGCFDGSASYTVNGSTYTGCVNPAQEPCKQIYECPADDAVHRIDPLAYPTDNPQLPTNDTVTYGSPGGIFDYYPPPTSFTDNAQRCMAWSIAEDPSSGATVRENGDCEGDGMLGATTPIPDGIFTYSNCSEHVGNKNVSNMGDSKIDVRFDPGVYKHVNVRDLALGEADVRVDAGLRWEVTPIVWGNEFTLLGVDAGAAVNRCGLDVRADVTLLEQDVDLIDLASSDGERFPFVTDVNHVASCKAALGLPRSLQEVLRMRGWQDRTPEEIDSFLRGSQPGDPYTFPARTPAEIRQWFMGNAENGFVMRANRAKKALIDARRVIQYWQSLDPREPLGQPFCAQTRTVFPEMASVPCGPRYVNRWITEYSTALEAMHSAAHWVSAGFGTKTLNQQGEYQLGNDQVPFDVLAVSFAFPVGPLSVLMEVSAGGYWGLGGRLNYEFMPSQLLTRPGGDIAQVGATVTPQVGAWVNLFVGAGVGGSVLGAHVGVSGELMVLQLELPLQARASLRQSAVPDPRAIGTDWAPYAWNALAIMPPVLQYPAESLQRQWSFGWNLDASADMTALSGKLDLAARIRLLFYTLQISKTIASYDGIPLHFSIASSGQPFSGPDIAGNFGQFGSDVPYTRVPLIDTLDTSHDGEAPVDASTVNSALGMSVAALSWGSECAQLFSFPVD